MIQVLEKKNKETHLCEIALYSLKYHYSNTHFFARWISPFLCSAKVPGLCKLTILVSYNLGYWCFYTSWHKSFKSSPNLLWPIPGRSCIQTLNPINFFCLFVSFLTDKQRNAGRVQLLLLNYYASSHWSIAVWIHGCDVLDPFENYFLLVIKATDHFFHVYIASYKHSGAGRILESYANPRIRLGFA